jgi:hypothetical protein
MSGGSVYKGHAFNKETANTSHENNTIHRTNFHSTVQVHEHYKNSRNRRYITPWNNWVILKQVSAVESAMKQWTTARFTFILKLFSADTKIALKI